MAKQANFDFAAAMRELEEINRWFQDADIDLDVGLEKLKKGKELIAACRDRLKSVENEFIKIREDFNAPSVATTAPERDGGQPVPESIPFAPRETDTPRPSAGSRTAMGDPDDDDLPF